MWNRGCGSALCRLQKTDKLPPIDTRTSLAHFPPAPPDKGNSTWAKPQKEAEEKSIYNGVNRTEPTEKRDVDLNVNWNIQRTTIETQTQTRAQTNTAEG